MHTKLTNSVTHIVVILVIVIITMFLYVRFQIKSAFENTKITLNTWTPGFQDYVEKELDLQFPVSTQILYCKYENSLDDRVVIVFTVPQCDFDKIPQIKMLPFSERKLLNANSITLSALSNKENREISKIVKSSPYSTTRVMVLENYSLIGPDQSTTILNMLICFPKKDKDIKNSERVLVVLEFF